MFPPFTRFSCLMAIIRCNLIYFVTTIHAMTVTINYFRHSNHPSQNYIPHSTFSRHNNYCFFAFLSPQPVAKILPHLVLKTFCSWCSNFKVLCLRAKFLRFKLRFPVKCKALPNIVPSIYIIQQSVENFLCLPCSYIMR